MHSPEFTLKLMGFQSRKRNSWTFNTKKNKAQFKQTQDNWHRLLINFRHYAEILSLRLADIVFETNI
ncbi:MAG: hypothetical protein CMP45_02240 [Rickettsiales bacterium]|nr:hypothetical protein [Verrucomicrobiaceae bacterium]MBV63313.1 hypothetical protein [Rickettsiales bacterium]|tara:strand:- start:76 stop:276 length:201 start_codon:yes stop_codon:yes gene_type:complete